MKEMMPFYGDQRVQKLVWNKYQGMFLHLLSISIPIRRTISRTLQSKTQQKLKSRRMRRSPGNQGGKYGDDFEHQDKSKIVPFSETLDIDSFDSTNNYSYKSVNIYSNCSPQNKSFRLRL